jgi:hypothetical protein
VEERPASFSFQALTRSLRLKGGRETPPALHWPHTHPPLASALTPVRRMRTAAEGVVVEGVEPSLDTVPRRARDLDAITLLWLCAAAISSPPPTFNSISADPQP